MTNSYRAEGGIRERRQISHRMRGGEVAHVAVLDAFRDEAEKISGEEQGMDVVWPEKKSLHICGG